MMKNIFFNFPHDGELILFLIVYRRLFSAKKEGNVTYREFSFAAGRRYIHPAYSVDKTLFAYIDS